MTIIANKCPQQSNEITTYWNTGRVGEPIVDQFTGQEYQVTDPISYSVTKEQLIERRLKLISELSNLDEEIAAIELAEQEALL